MAGCIPSGSAVLCGRSSTTSTSYVSNVEDVVLPRRTAGGNCMFQSSSYMLEKRAANRLGRPCSSSGNCNLGCLHEDLGREELMKRRTPASSRADRYKNVVSLLPGVGGSFWEGAESDSSASERFQQKKGPGKKRRDRSVLLSLIQEIEPLDVSHISKDASVNSMDAMKRTISGMLGILPSDQFRVSVEMEREPLARLLVSAMMTGYTLRNAEYRMCLQRSLDLTTDADVCRLQHTEGSAKVGRDSHEGNLGSESQAQQDMPDTESTACTREDSEVSSPAFDAPVGLDDLSPEALAYIQRLQSQMSAASQELEGCKRTLAELGVDNVVADDQNEVLDYLRSLDPDKVAELSQPTSAEVEDVIQQVIMRLLGNLSPLWGATPLGSSAGGSGSTTASGSPLSGGWERAAGAELPGNVPLQFQATVTASRDYLARLLFWCMLLGHHMRALEYRLELSRTFSLHADVNLL